MVEPITTVSSSKSKKTATKSASKKKKSPKTKRDELKTSLSMADLYVKENPFISTVVEPSIGTFVKDPQRVDTKANPKIASDVAKSETEKGNPNETIPSSVSESCKKLGLEDLNDAIEITENMDIDDPKIGNESTTNDFVQLSPEKADGREDVGPDVETSLDQQEKQDDDAETPVEDESGYEDGSEKD